MEDLEKKCESLLLTTLHLIASLRGKQAYVRYLSVLSDDKQIYKGQYEGKPCRDLDDKAYVLAMGQEDREGSQVIICSASSRGQQEVPPDGLPMSYDGKVKKSNQ